MSTKQTNLLKKIFNYNYNVYRESKDIVAYNVNNENTNFCIYSRFDIDDQMLLNRPKLYCIDCDKEITPCKNQKFRHKKDTCRKYNKTKKHAFNLKKSKYLDMHLLAETLLCETNYLICPSSMHLNKDLCLFDSFRLEVNPNDTNREFVTNDIIPDIKFVDKYGNIFFIEILYTHDIDNTKIRKILNNNCTVLQIDISPIDTFIEENLLFRQYENFQEDSKKVIKELQRLLFDETTNKEWINIYIVNEFIKKQYKYLKEKQLLLKNNYQLSNKIDIPYLFFLPKNLIYFYDIKTFDISTKILENNVVLFNISNINLITNYIELLKSNFYEKYIVEFMKNPILYNNIFESLETIDNKYSKDVYKLFDENIVKIKQNSMFIDNMKILCDSLSNYYCTKKINLNHNQHSDIIINCYKFIEILSKHINKNRLCSFKNLLLLCNKDSLLKVWKYFINNKLIMQSLIELNLITEKDINEHKENYKKANNNKILNNKQTNILNNVDVIFEEIKNGLVADNKLKNHIIKLLHGKSKNDFTERIIKNIVFEDNHYIELTTIAFKNENEYFNYLISMGFCQNTEKTQYILLEIVNDVCTLYNKQSNLNKINNQIQKICTLINNNQKIKNEIFIDNIDISFYENFYNKHQNYNYSTLNELKLYCINNIFNDDLKKIVKFILTTDVVNYQNCKIANSLDNFCVFVLDIYNDEFYYETMSSIVKEILKSNILINEDNFDTFNCCFQNYAFMELV